VRRERRAVERDQFQARLAPLDDAALRKVLWTVHWRGGAAVRQRIEAEIEAGTPGRQPVPAAPTPTIDPDQVRGRVVEFAALVRKGAYLAGDRRVSPKQRTRWRFIFRDLFADARRALAADDPTPAATAMATLIDIACETGGLDYFRSEDPVEAAKIVISDEVGVLWRRVRDHAGFPAFAALAAPQLVRRRPRRTTVGPVGTSARLDPQRLGPGQ
jgi:hypothetical protein